MIRVNVGNVWCKLTCPPEVLEIMRDAFKIKKPVTFGQRRKYAESDYRYLIWVNGRFRSGMKDDVLMVLRSLGYEPEVIDQRVNPGRLENKVIRWNLEASILTPRPYQMEAFLRGLASPTGIFDMCTGSGKTFVLALLIQNLDQKSCVFVNSVDLARQLRSEIAEYANLQLEDIGFIGNGYFIEKQFNICIVQTVAAAKGKKRTRLKKFLASLGCVIVDECHHGQASSYQNVLQWSKNAYYRYGFSATPLASMQYGSDNTTFRNNAVLKEYFGNTLYSVSTRDMIDMGYLAEPKIKIIRNTHEAQFEYQEYAGEARDSIAMNRDRNGLICDIAYQALQEGKQTIGFTRLITHGLELQRIFYEDYNLSEADMDVVTGEDHPLARKRKIESFKNGTLPILFGTVLSEGLNVFCDVGINAADGKDRKNLIQRLGRVLRKKRVKEGSDVDTSTRPVIMYYDFADHAHPMFSKHGRHKERVYRDLGHEVTQIEPGDL